ncbi:MAG: ion transporter [Gammaproteobacteria bacterium]|nr:ion transporter [Gammaproteobacteria bacterium]
MREKAGNWIESTPIQAFIIFLIVINAVILGMETAPQIMATHGDLLLMVDAIILGVFVIEILIKLFAFRLGFFNNAWNVFDFIVVGIALVPASGPLAVLRALRVLRVLRLISMLPQLRLVVEALLKAIPGISSVFALMSILFYVFSVMATTMFGKDFPTWFGSIGDSMYTLFQIMTLESWSMGIVRPVMEQHPYAWAFFVPFILIATFTMLNLFIGIIVNTMQTIHEQHSINEIHAVEAVVHADSDKLNQQLQKLEHEILGLRTLLQENKQ